MNYLASIFHPYYVELANKVKNGDFVTDKSGCKIVEIFAPRIEFDLNKTELGYIDFESRKSPRKYCELEKYWYGTQSLNIDDVNTVNIWNKVCDVNNQVNSNYGYLVFSKGNFCQYSHVIEKLKNDRDTRQAIIIYTRPSMQVEWNDMGSTDFICTNFQHFFIRNNKLYCITSMRSNDCIFGTFNDIVWFVHVAKKMYEDLKKEKYNNLELGNMIFAPNSFHCYECHFELLQKIANESVNNITYA